MKKILASIEKLEQQKRDIDEIIKQKKAEIVRQFSPVSVGDRVKVNGWAHEGREMVVLHVTFEQRQRIDLGETFFKCRGVLLKKDGTESVLQGEHFC